MDAVQLVAFAFLVGLTFCGLAGSAMELAGGKKLSFAAPYVSPGRVLRSLAAAAAAGPLMLANDALDAWREGRISLLSVFSCACTVFGWTLALGVVLIDIASRASLLLL